MSTAQSVTQSRLIAPKNRNAIDSSEMPSRNALIAGLSWWCTGRTWTVEPSASAISASRSVGYAASGALTRSAAPSSRVAGRHGDHRARRYVQQALGHTADHQTPEWSVAARPDDDRVSFVRLG